MPHPRLRRSRTRPRPSHSSHSAHSAVHGKAHATCVRRTATFAMYVALPLVRCTFCHVYAVCFVPVYGACYNGRCTLHARVRWIMNAIRALHAACCMHVACCMRRMPLVVRMPRVMSHATCDAAVPRAMHPHVVCRGFQRAFIRARMNLDGERGLCVSRC